MGSNRDHFLMAPTSDFRSALELEAQCSDSHACSNLLLQRLPHFDGAPPLLIVDGSSACWTEQGDRATIPSVAACVDSLPTDWVDDLGRWSSESSHAYIRTQLRRVSSIQVSVARLIIEGVLSADKLGEADVYAQWASYLVSNGVPQDTAVTQASRLGEATTRQFRVVGSGPLEHIHSNPATCPFCTQIRGLRRAFASTGELRCPHSSSFQIQAFSQHRGVLIASRFGLRLT